VFRLALSISDLSSLPSLLGMHGFHICGKGGAGPGLGQHTGGNGGSNGNGVRGGRRPGGMESSAQGSLPPGGQMSPQHWGGGGGGSSGGGGEGKNDCGAADEDVTDMAARGGGSRHFMWREEQIKQFAYLIRGGEAAVGD
jgi:hypothetical protein